EASITTVAEIVLAATARLRLDDGLEASEAGWPELLQKLFYGAEPLRSDDVEAARTLWMYRDEARVFKHLEMLGHGLLADVELRGKVIY
ncbi:MAG: hypothetical protein QOI08_2729, partial [Actinomycetota bacterium]|nr:hypothetical protein [Actinomycetota bacterium]